MAFEGEFSKGGFLKGVLGFAGHFEGSSWVLGLLGGGVFWVSGGLRGVQGLGEPRGGFKFWGSRVA